VAGMHFPVVWSIVGAALFVAVINLNQLAACLTASIALNKLFSDSAKVGCAKMASFKQV